MPYFLYASFPNSRIKPRPSTVNAITRQVDVTSQNDAAPELTLVQAANLNRTYIILQNLDQTFDAFYFYASTQVIDPSVVATFGVIDQKIWNPVSKILYNKTDDGTTTNWVAVLPANLTDVGEKIGSYQSATLESLGDIYAIGTQAALAFLTLGIDQGRG